MSSAPPGGGPTAVVIAATNQPAAPAAVDPATQLPIAQPAAPAAPVQPAADALNLSAPAAPAQPSAPAAPAPAAIPDYGDNGLNIAADYFVNTVGLSVDSRELTEAAAGNFALLEAKLEVLGDKAKGSGPILALAKESINRLKANAEQLQKATVTAVHEAVGGEANWQAVQQFARTNLSPEQLKQASEALTSGGFAAVAVAKQLLAMAQSHPAVTVQGQPAVNPGAPAASLQGVAPITKEQYREEYRKLLAEKGIKGAANSPELRALNARVIH